MGARKCQEPYLELWWQACTQAMRWLRPIRKGCLMRLLKRHRKMMEREKLQVQVRNRAMEREIRVVAARTPSRA